jgi:hypothetical protein
MQKCYEAMAVSSMSYGSENCTLKREELREIEWDLRFSQRWL